ncbi:MAG TPA: hypothetical protein VGW78_01865 [Candidatus Babeliales bacterium]|jgi:chloramphenicol 3-O-phosphotransferase|nr:hypothetical protein [Candidatus Babeliales bacterium]
MIQKHAIYLLLFSFLLSVCFIKQYGTTKKNESTNLSNGTLIVLSGTTSSGKTSTAQALQTLYATEGIAYLHMPGDAVFAMLPKQWINFNPHDANKTITDGLQFIRIDDEHGPKIQMKVGKTVLKLILGIFPTINTYLDYGNNIIFDSVIMCGWLKQIAPIMAHKNAYFIGITCSKEVALAREKSRDGFPGLVRGQLEATGDDAVHEPGIYDLLIDTTNISSEQAARQIKDYVENNKPKAFMQIWSKASEYRLY